MFKKINPHYFITSLVMVVRKKWVQRTSKSYSEIILISRINGAGTNTKNKNNTYGFEACSD